MLTVENCFMPWPTSKFNPRVMFGLISVTSDPPPRSVRLTTKTHRGLPGSSLLFLYEVKVKHHIHTLYQALLGAEKVKRSEWRKARESQSTEGCVAGHATNLLNHEPKYSVPACRPNVAWLAARPSEQNAPERHNQ